MKVNGTDPMIKLILEFNNQNYRMPTSVDKINMENLSTQVEEIFMEKDEVLLRGELLIKPEIQYTRQLYETPEVYLQRISSEMLKMKNSQNGIPEEQRRMLHTNDETTDIVLSAGLLKGYVDHDKIQERASSDTKETRWLQILSVSFISLLLIYLIFHK